MLVLCYEKAPSDGRACTFDVVFSETVTSLAYFLLESGQIVDPSTVLPPSEDELTRSVFDLVARGRYRQFTSTPVFRLGDAFYLYVVGRLDAADARTILLAITADWQTLLGIIKSTV